MTSTSKLIRNPAVWTTALIIAFGLMASTGSAQPVPEDVRLAVEAMNLDENGIPEGAMVIHGDIIVPENFYELGETSATYTTRDVFWPNGIVPYVFDPGVSNTNRTRMINAMAEWEDVANVDFRVRTSEPNWLYIQNGGGNNSWVGVQGGGQVVNIVSWTNRWIICHELNHALGYWHEQSRADRNNFVTVDLSNVSQTACSGNPCDPNFNRIASAGFYGPYDYDSVMHYGPCSFSICGGCPNSGTCSNGGQTIFANNGTAIGQRTHLSKWDVITTSFHYPFSNWRFAENSCRCDFVITCVQDGTFWCPYDSFLDGYNNTPAGGGLWLPRNQIFPNAEGTYTKRMMIRAPLGALLR